MYRISYFFQIKNIFSNLTQQLRTVKGVELNMANIIYIAQDAELNKQFAVSSNDIFNSEVKNIDFSKKTAYSKINAWVIIFYFFYRPVSRVYFNTRFLSSLAVNGE